MRNITGSRIRLARLSKQLTQEQLAVQLQVAGLNHTRTTIAKIESGIRQINDLELKAIATILGCSITWLFEEEM